MRLNPRIPPSIAAVLLLIPLGCSRVGPSRPLDQSLPAKRPTSRSLFRDTAQELGLSATWGSGGRSPLDIRETIGHGCSFLDYDNDGKLDVLLVGNNSCTLYHNEGGHFVDVTPASGPDITGPLCGVAIGDYDNDGFVDLYVTGYGKCALYHNRGSQAGKRFEDRTATAGVGPLNPFDFVTAAAFVDVDNDGRLDLIAARYIKFVPLSPRYCTYNGVLTTCGVQNYEPAKPMVYRNQGDGRFVDVTARYGFDSMHGRCLGLSIRASDTGRGVEIYAANDEMPCDLMARRGDKYSNIGLSSGTAFNREGITQGGMGCDWGDFSGDGRTDLVVATFEAEPKCLYRAENQGVYTDISAETGLSFNTLPYVAWTAKFMDYDNDGWLDLLITNGHIEENARKVDSSKDYPQPLQLFHNEAGQRLQPVSKSAGDAFASPIVGRGASIGDYDNDGREDILLVNDEGRVMLLHNEEGGSNQWLGIRLIGKRCNRDAVGARVIVSAGGRALVRDLQLCGGYVSGQDGRLHFGLGSADHANRIEVRWPDGTRQAIQGADPRLRAGQYVTIAEP